MTETFLYEFLSSELNSGRRKDSLTAGNVCSDAEIQVNNRKPRDGVMCCYNASQYLLFNFIEVTQNDTLYMSNVPQHDVTFSDAVTSRSMSCYV